MTERDHDEMTFNLAIGKLVAQLRIARSLSARELGKEIRYDFSYVHKIERGELASDAVMQALDDFFGLDGALMALVYVARKGKLQEYGKNALLRETKADGIQVFASSKIPSLLQTDQYALAQLRTRSPKMPSEYFAESVAHRMNRQRIFQREDPPLYWAIVDETVLRRPVGGDSVMAGQLAWVREMAKRPYVNFQVIPFDQGEHWMMGGSLTLMTAPNGSTSAYVESFDSGEFVEPSKRVVELARQFKTACSIALSEAESLRLVERYIEEYK